MAKKQLLYTPLVTVSEWPTLDTVAKASTNGVEQEQLFNGGKLYENKHQKSA